VPESLDGQDTRPIVRWYLPAMASDYFSSRQTRPVRWNASPLFPPPGFLKRVFEFSARASQSAAEGSRAPCASGNQKRVSEFSDTPGFLKRVLDFFVSTGQPAPARSRCTVRIPEKKHRARSTEHRAQSTEHRAQSTEHRAQSTEHRAQSTEHRRIAHWGSRPPKEKDQGA
jgi:hypothetical protein